MTLRTEVQSSHHTMGKSNASSLAYSLTSGTFKLTESDYIKGGLDSSKEGTLWDSVDDSLQQKLSQKPPYLSEKHTKQGSRADEKQAGHWRIKVLEKDYTSSNGSSYADDKMLSLIIEDSKLEQSSH